MRSSALAPPSGPPCARASRVWPPSGWGQPGTSPMAVTSRSHWCGSAERPVHLPGAASHQGPIRTAAPRRRQTRVMHGIITANGTTSEATAEAIGQLIDAHQFLWLDLDGVDDQAHDLLLNVFHA